MTFDYHKYNTSDEYKIKNKARMAKLRANNPDFVKLEYKLNHKRNQRIKKEVLSHYADPLECKWCGIDIITVLTIDHEKGGGSKHRKALKMTMYRWLRKNNYPPGYQVLCMNCQFLKRWMNKEW